MKFEYVIQDNEMLKSFLQTVNNILKRQLAPLNIMAL